MAQHDHDNARVGGGDHEPQAIMIMIVQANCDISDFKFTNLNLLNPAPLNPEPVSHFLRMVYWKIV